jgi:hypothetical protein
LLVIGTELPNPGTEKKKTAGDPLTSTDFAIFQYNTLFRKIETTQIRPHLEAEYNIYSSVIPRTTSLRGLSCSCWPTFNLPQTNGQVGRIFLFLGSFTKYERRNLKYIYRSTIVVSLNNLIADFTTLREKAKLSMFLTN